MSQRSNVYSVNAVSCNSSPASDSEGSGHLASQQSIPLDSSSGNAVKVPMHPQLSLSERRGAGRDDLHFEAPFVSNLDDELVKCVGQSGMAGLRSSYAIRPLDVGNGEDFGELVEDPEEYVDITPLPLSGVISPYSVVSAEKIDTTISPEESGSTCDSEKTKQLSKSDDSFSCTETTVKGPEDDYEVMLPFGQGNESVVTRSADSPPSKLDLWRHEVCSLDTPTSSLDNSRSSFPEYNRQSSKDEDEEDNDARDHDYADPDFVSNVRAGRELLMIRPEDYEDGVSNEMGYSPGVQPPSRMLHVDSSPHDSPAVSKSYRRLRHLSDKRTNSLQSISISGKTSEIPIRRKSEPEALLRTTSSEEKKKKRPAYVFISQTLGRPNRKSKSNQSSPETSSLTNFATSSVRSRVVSLSISRAQSPSPPTSQESSPPLSTESRLQKLKEKRLRRHTTSFSGGSPPQTLRSKFTLFSLHESSVRNNVSTPADSVISTGTLSSESRRDVQQEAKYGTDKQLLGALMKSTLV